MFGVITGLSGLVGFANSFTMPVFLLGSNFSILIIRWADPTLPILYRKVMLIVYFIVIIIFILMFVNYKKEEEYNFYSSALYVPLSLGRDSSSPRLWAKRMTGST